MSHNRHRCTYTGAYQPEANRGESREYSHAEVHGEWPHIADALESLEVGKTLVDKAGDTWERIA